MQPRPAPRPASAPASAMTPIVRLSLNYCTPGPKIVVTGGLDSNDHKPICAKSAGSMRNIRTRCSFMASH
jgi:hypothetical protein